MTGHNYTSFKVKESAKTKQVRKIMTAITNKKGAVGFLLQKWNFHQGLDNSVFVKGDEIEFRAVKVKVHSCGKKEMKLIPLNSEFLSSYLIFKHSEILFTDLDGAKAQADFLFSKMTNVEGKSLNVLHG